MTKYKENQTVKINIGTDNNPKWKTATVKAIHKNQIDVSVMLTTQQKLMTIINEKINKIMKPY